MADFIHSTEVMGKYMAEAGAAGYTGVLYLYHQSTTHFIVQWTGANLSQWSKESAEQHLLEVMTTDFGNTKEEPVSAPASAEIIAQAEPEIPDSPTEPAIGNIQMIATDMITAACLEDSDSHTGPVVGDDTKPVIAESSAAPKVEQRPNVIEFTAADWMVVDIKTEPVSESLDIPTGNKIMVEEGDSSPHLLAAGTGEASHKSDSTNSRLSTNDPNKANPLQCRICNKSFYDVSTRVRHEKTTHSPYKPYKCTVCHKSYPRRDYLVIHYRYHTGERPYKCEVCNKSYMSNGNLSFHLRSNPDHRKADLGRRPDQSTGKLTFHAPYQAEHQKADLGGLPPQNTGNLSFNPLSNPDHRKVALGRRPHQSTARLTFHPPYHPGHRKTDHKALSHQSTGNLTFNPDCQKADLRVQPHQSTGNLSLNSLSNPNYQKADLRVQPHQSTGNLLFNALPNPDNRKADLGKLPHQSAARNELAQQQSTPNLKQIPTVQASFQCATCNKTFSTSNRLYTHQLIHTGRSPLQCRVCSKSFYDVSTRVRHERTTHLQEKPYQCTVCHKSYPRRDYLTIHIRSHTGEKPYKCRVCKKSFTSNRILSQHSRSHSVKASHLVAHSDSLFSHANPLQDHLRAYTEESSSQQSHLDQQS